MGEPHPIHAARHVDVGQHQQLLGTERDGETTHLCAADRDGTVVSLTQSIQSLFGAKVANEEYGFLYNNYLTTCPRRAHAHRVDARRHRRALTRVREAFGTGPRGG